MDNCVMVRTRDDDGGPHTAGHRTLIESARDRQVEPAGVRPVRPAGCRRSASARLALLLDLGGLAAQLAEVVQLRPADVAAGDDLDPLDDRGVHREGALHADAEADLADGESLADAAALTADDDALEDLDA